MINGMPVMDAVIHAYNMAPENYANRFAKPLCDLVYGSMATMSAPGYAPTETQAYRDWSIEETVDQVFVESDTDLAVYHVLPIFCFADGMCNLDKAIEAKRRWPNRVLTYCGVDPMAGAAALDDMDRQVELLQPVGLKLYPNSWLGSEIRGWQMDDPEIAFPLFERARKLGIKVVAVHKAVPLGPVSMQHYRVDDIDRACMAFPDLNFEIVHGGMAFLEETAWQIARFPNAYVNLEITSSMVVSRPEAFRQAIAALVAPGGTYALSKLLWGTGAIAFHPQPLLEAFVRFGFPEEMMAGQGLPEITEAVRRDILFNNYARMAGIDLHQMLQASEDDEFARRRAEGPHPAFSTARVR